MLFQLVIIVKSFPRLIVSLKSRIVAVTLASSGTSMLESADGFKYVIFRMFSLFSQITNSGKIPNLSFCDTYIKSNCANFMFAPRGLGCFLVVGKLSI